MSIGDNIKALRKENNLTQTELADMLGTTKQNIYKYENGIITNIPSDKIEIMAEKFDVSPADIMGWNQSIKKDIPVRVDENALFVHLQEKYSDDELELLSSVNRNQAVEIVQQVKKMKEE